MRTARALIHLREVVYRINESISLLKAPAGRGVANYARRQRLFIGVYNHFSPISVVILTESLETICSQFQFLYNSISAIVDQIEEYENDTRVQSLPSSIRLDTTVTRLLEDLDDALGTLRHISNFVTTETVIQSELKHLTRIVPEQKIAPMRFTFQNNKLMLSGEPSHVDSEDLGNVEAAYAYIISDGKKLRSYLEESNSDKRLLQVLCDLDDRIEKRENVIAVGMSCINLEVVGNQFEHELPDAILGMLRSHVTLVMMYIAQFPDWNRFIENVAITQIDSSFLKEITLITESLINELENNRQIVDQSIPITFRMLNRLLKQPSKEIKKAAFAMLRSIENLVSKIIQVFLEFVGQTTTKLVERASTAASRVVVIALVSLAIGGAVKITPLAEGIVELGWLKHAVEIVQRQMKGLE